MTRRSNLIDVELNLIMQTDKAIRVGDSTDPSEGVWLPKSQIEFVERGCSIVEVTMPEWLALEKGFI